jgi:hypothetical protein
VADLGEGFSNRVCGVLRPSISYRDWDSVGAPGKIRTCAHGLGIRKRGGNDGAGQYPTGRFPQVGEAMTEGDGSNRIRVPPEL